MVGLGGNPAATQAHDPRFKVGARACVAAGVPLCKKLNYFFKINYR